MSNKLTPEYVKSRVKSFDCKTEKFESDNTVRINVLFDNRFMWQCRLRLDQEVTNDRLQRRKWREHCLDLFAEKALFLFRFYVYEDTYFYYKDKNERDSDYDLEY